ncbi:MAG: GGDEF domain-containing protein [Notoacmeibacter sp.]|nr:GGDEF domain-containing protein [Notoacmeibacter sp.]
MMKKPKKLLLSLVYGCCFFFIPTYFYLVIHSRTDLHTPVQAVFLLPAIVAFVVSYAVSMRNHELNRALADLDSANRQLARAYEMLKKKSNMDSMTGMLNREAFFEALERLRRKSDAGALLIVDADHFKAINDNYGHLTGDEALLAITDAIVKSVSDCDILGRIGGEEFAVYLAGASPTDASAVAERIRSAVEALHFEPRTNVVRALSVSIGGTLIKPGASISEMMREADSRLYEAKNAGRNRVVLPHGMDMAA